MSQIVVELRHVNKKFKRKNILNNVNLKIYENHVYGFSGPNGAGKTLTFKTILGFIKPNNGDVIVEGKLIRKEVMFAENIGFSIQEYGVLGDKTATENLSLLNILNNQDETADMNIQQLLSYVGLDPNNKDKVNHYSLGMKQRLSLAVALLNGNKILIFDEPTNALDDSGQDFLVAMINDLKLQGKTILISSHDKYFLNQVSDHIFKFNEGTIVGEQIL